MISNDSILLATSILWFLPMLVYHNSNLKYLFAILGCTGLVVFLAQSLFYTETTLLIVLGQLLTYFSLQNKKLMIKQWKSNITIVVVSIALLLFLPNPLFTYPILCFAVMWKLQKIAVIDYLKNEKVDFFFAILVVYQVIVVLYSVLLIFGSTYIELTNYIYAICQVIIIVSMLLLKKSAKPLIAKLSLSP